MNFNIVVCDEVEEGYTTHLVMKSTKRTIKLSQAVLYGVHVIDYKWIKKSMQHPTPKLESIEDYRIFQTEPEKLDQIFEGKDF